MDSNVPQAVSNELTQILSNLVLGDNEIRSKYAYFLWSSYSRLDDYSAEKVVNERLSQTPELYILAMAQFSATATDEVRSLTHNHLLASKL